MTLRTKAQAIADALEDAEGAAADLPADHPVRVKLADLHDRLRAGAEFLGFEIVDRGATTGPGYVAFSGGTNKDPPGGGGGGG